MPARHIFVISDLHLGGADGFQMCGAPDREQLAGFIKALAEHSERVRSVGEQAELVINGDIIDFLAEDRIDRDRRPELARWEAFTEDPRHAVAKLERIARDVAGNVFAELRSFVAKRNRLLLLLGNHDVELSVPPVRRKLLELLNGDEPARVEFVHDGEAYVDGDLHIEHGNRYDAWNQVAFDDLRRYRSALTRGEEYRGLFQPPPGSELVVAVMNDLKRDHPWVDLLKPERAVTLPLLVSLRPDVLKKLRTVIPLRYRAWTQRTRDGMPINEKAISANDQLPPDLEDRGRINWGKADDELIGLWDQELAALALPTGAQAISSQNPISVAFRRLLTDLANVRGQTWAYALLEVLSRAKRLNGATFDLRYKDKEEWPFATRLFERGRRVVVFGHTHLARDIAVSEGRYINTGTWCPLIRLPEVFFGGGELSRQVLAEKLEKGLRDIDACKWRKAQRTYARIKLVEGRVESASLNLWDGSSLDRTYEGFAAPEF